MFKNFKRIFDYKYFYNRLRLEVHQRKNPFLPWLTYDSIRILNDLISKNDEGVEFGSGSSTIWLAKRMHSLTSVEHDKKWYKLVSNQLKGCSEEIKINYLLKEKKHEYIEIPKMFEENSVDFCLIDGWQRDICTNLMIPKIKKGGLLVIDNANWDLSYKKVYSPCSRGTSGLYENDLWKKNDQILSKWGLIWTTNGVNDTAIYIKK